MARLANNNVVFSDGAVSIRPNVTNLADYKKTRLVGIEETTLGRIKVIGVGNAGGDAVNRMCEAGVQGVEFLVANTDPEALRASRASLTIQLGEGTERELSTTGRLELGKQAALEGADRLLDALKDADIVFVAADLGGGTGAGAAPIIASLAAQLGAFTIAIVTLPSGRGVQDGESRPLGGMDELLQSVNCAITIPRERPSTSNTKASPFVGEFDLADAVLSQAVQSISDIVALPGLINVDLADVKAIMQGSVSLMGVGSASGENRAVVAVQLALSSPLLREAALETAEGLLVNVTGSSDVTLFEICEAMSLIHDSANPEADIIFGAVIDERLSDEIRITVIATHPVPPSNSSELSYEKRPMPLEDLSAQFDSLIARMQSSNARKGMKTAFNASPAKLGRAAVKAARKRRLR